MIAVACVSFIAWLLLQKNMHIFQTLYTGKAEYIQ